ncbi:heat shock 70 kDa protein 12A-like [Poeciliopsis prolifica]|uniref:heat shock 70 kDa protein 12A-like n=1 Tax=Poeciliopsis prolifica TaxID=188132 RepID=UPI00241343F0|nr:heat shock 70 kDa protein 12A-like [Poeciliopsis prolifica]
MSVYRVEVDSGVESVLLPFKTAVWLPEEVEIKWRHNSGRIVHGCYRDVFLWSVDFGSWCVQHDQYKDRTEIEKEGKFGDFSLILKNPTDRDTGTYSCIVYEFGSERVLTRKQVLLDVKAGPDSLIIAIDFGSGFSGYAFNVKPREEGGETQIKRWSNGLGLDTPKTPTCILFDEPEEFMKFGLQEEGIEAANKKQMTELKVFTETLRFLKDDALKTIRSHTVGGRFTADDFTWVLTVPELLEDSTKQFIIKSATQAGLVTDDTKDKLMFVLESEAALTWCLNLQPDGFIKQNHSRDSQDQPAEPAEPDTSCNDPAGSQEAVKFIVEPEETKVLLETQRDGKRFLVVDCGDKNINFTVHDVLKGGAIKKLQSTNYFRTENNLGRRYVKKEFKQILQKIFSDEVWNEYEQNFSNGVQKMIFDFTRLEEMGEDVQISCPDNLVMLAQKNKEIETFFDSVEGASWNNGSIRINREKLKSFYDESLQGITKKLREILNKNLNIGYIVLVGGFAESQILRQHITDQFGPQYKVLCPLRPQEVILKGAVELGRNPKLVESQRKRPAWFKCLS